MDRRSSAPGLQEKRLLAEGRAAQNKQRPSPDVERTSACVSPSVVGSGTNSNTRRRLERLVSAWEQAKRGDADDSELATETEPDVVSHPSRRNRTPLTEKEVEAIRTARERGESVLSIAKHFGIHRGTVWRYTHHLHEQKH